MLRLGIDIDGVLGNFTRSFANVANSIWKDKIPLDYSPTHWDWRDSGLTKEEISEVWEKLKDVNNFWMREAPYLDNVEVLRAFLMAPEHRDSTTVYYITSRIPTRSGHSVMVQTQKWLESWNLLLKNTSVLPVVHDSTNVTTTPPKKKIVEALGIEAHVDDYLPTVRDLGEQGFLLDRSWNREGRSVQDKVVGSLQEFLEKFSI